MVAAIIMSPAMIAQPGIFEGHGDVGTVLHPGSVEYNAAQKTYRVTASGENLWGTADAFHFVWKKVTGDVSVTAEISFATTTGEPHKKAVLMVRQSLDADAAYADAVVHNSGKTSLQSREEKGAATHTVQGSSCLYGCFSRPQQVVFATKLANEGAKLGRDRSHIAGFVRPSSPRTSARAEHCAQPGCDRPIRTTERRHAPPLLTTTSGGLLKQP